jgi:hypothetical protein
MTWLCLRPQQPKCSFSFSLLSQHPHYYYYFFEREAENICVVDQQSTTQSADEESARDSTCSDLSHKTFWRLPLKILASNMYSSHHPRLLFFSIAAVLVVVSSAFSPHVGGNTKPSLTKLASASCPDDRREFLTQAGVLGSALLLGPNWAQAGLLDEYGSDPSKIAEKPKEAIAAVAKKGADVQIDPTLRACKFKFDMFLFAFLFRIWCTTIY